jgi:hypothetical protein
MWKYSVEINEDEIIDYLYSYIERTNGLDWVAFIRAISIWEASETEIWFKETSVNLSIKIPNEKRLKEILDFLTSSKSKYNFFLESFTFPYGKTDNSFNVSIPLKIIYN